jgi:hypothetical protein
MFSPRARWLAVLALPVVPLLIPGSIPGNEMPATPPSFLLDISREFVNAAVEQSIDRTDTVEDVILKTHITGTGRTVGKVGAALIPSDQAAIVDLVTTGTTTAATVGVNGPVQLYSDSTLPFQIHQRITIRPEGIEADEPQTNASGESTLTGMATDFHGLLDRVVKKIACRKYRKSKDEANYIADRRAETQLSEGARGEAGPRLRDADEGLKKNLADLRARGIAYTGLRFASSADTLFVRAQSARAAIMSMPPPLAARSYLALRVHESIINESTDPSFAGKTFTGEDLEKEAKKLGWSEGPMPKDDKDFSITFAKDRPVEVTFANQGFQAVMRLTEFTSGEDEYKGMDMTVKYRFVTKGDTIKAVRQGPIEAFPPSFKAGQKLSARQQAMRTVLQKRFGKFFKEELVLKDVMLAKDLRRAGPLVATRADGERGWLLVTWRKGSP